MIFPDQVTLIEYLKTIPNNITVTFRTLPDGRFSFDYKELKEKEDRDPN